MGVSKKYVAEFDLNSLRVNLTGTVTTFVLTPSSSAPAKITNVLAIPNATSGPFSMSYGVVSVGAPGGNILHSSNGGFFTGVITGGTYVTASLSLDESKLVIGAGSLCYITSSNHTGNMAVEIFYKLIR